jgi:hypothetical protein
MAESLPVEPLALVAQRTVGKGVAHDRKASMREALDGRSDR